jgi:glycosyltransferase involved in cell wall biosynthesis
VWLGNKSAKQDPDVVAAGLRDCVQGVEPGTMESLVELYNAVDCLLFPSVYEGFGWPPLEAMACGIPVICSNAGSLLEVVGDAAFIADPMDVNAFVRHIETFMNDKFSVKVMVDKGLARAALFSWERHARSVLDVYKNVLQ